MELMIKKEVIRRIKELKEWKLIKNGIDNDVREFKKEMKGE